MSEQGRPQFQGEIDAFHTEGGVRFSRWVCGVEHNGECKVVAADSVLQTLGCMGFGRTGQ
jgi:hypothetical protein